MSDHFILAIPLAYATYEVCGTSYNLRSEAQISYCLTRKKPGVNYQCCSVGTRHDFDVMPRANLQQSICDSYVPVKTNKRVLM